MWGLPEDFDGSIFIGRELECISFHHYPIHLYFDKEVAITIESSFEYRPANDDAKVELQSVPVTSSAIMQLVGKTVEACEIERPGTLMLRFEGGDIFRVFDDDSGYESYHISHGQNEIHV